MTFAPKFFSINSTDLLSISTRSWVTVLLMAYLNPLVSMRWSVAETTGKESLPFDKGRWKFCTSGRPSSEIVAPSRFWINQSVVWASVTPFRPLSIRTVIPRPRACWRTYPTHLFINVIAVVTSPPPWKLTYKLFIPLWDMWSIIQSMAALAVLHGMSLGWSPLFE